MIWATDATSIAQKRFVDFFLSLHFNSRSINLTTFKQILFDKNWFEYETPTFENFLCTSAWLLSHMSRSWMRTFTVWQAEHVIYILTQNFQGVYSQNKFIDHSIDQLFNQSINPSISWFIPLSLYTIQSTAYRQNKHDRLLVPLINILWDIRFPAIKHPN